MANLLCKYEATTGSYRNLFKEIELLESVTPTDVCRVATLLFDKDNCIKGSVTSSFV
jgi:predicted Zn-dependent peptidase